MTAKTAVPFQFKKFSIAQDQCSMKVGTDGVLLGAWADVSDATRILDIGAGTGLIAIMLAQRNEDALVHAVEIDDAACTQAVTNMENSPFSNRLTSFPVSIQDYSFKQEKYDLIVSNPPFFSGGTLSNNSDRDAVRHTVKLPHGALLLSVQRLLANKGKFAVILPFIEGLRFEEMAATYNLYCTRKTEVKPKAEKSVERLLLEFERVKKEPTTDQLVIQKDARNDWTDEYIALTGDFYLKM